MDISSSRRQNRGRIGPSWLVVMVIVVVGLVASACGASASVKNAKSTAPVSGHPNLSGDKFVIDIGSPTPVLSKATASVAVSILNSWGAQATLVNIGACNKGGELVLTGRAQVTLCPPSVALNSGLIAFGSNQPRVNYLLVAKQSIGTPSALSGHVIGLNDPTGTEATLLPYLLHHYHASGVSTVVLGTQPVLLGALASGRIDAGLVLPEQWMALKKKTKSLHLLVSVATALPDFADSYLLASHPWLTANRSLAVAIDEAWLQARQVFNNDESKWVTASLAYTAGRYSVPVAQATWQQEHALGIWPASSFGFTKTILEYNAQAAYTAHAAKRLLPVSQWTDSSIWTAAASHVYGGKAS